MRYRALLAALLVAGCTGSGASTAKGPSPAPAYFDPCPAARGDKVEDGLPSIRLACLGPGPDVHLEALRGPMLVNVWGSWCLPCQREVPALQAFYAKAKGRVGVLGIDINDSSGSAQDFAGHVGMTYPSVVDDDSVIRGHGPFVFSGPPMTVFLDASGRVVHVERQPFRKLAQIEQLVSTYLGVTL